MNASELKYHVESTGNTHFERAEMKFFGDTMRNYGVRAVTVRSDYNQNGEYVPGGGVKIEAWELYRKHAVKHGNKSSAFFSKDTYTRLHCVTIVSE